MHTRERIVALEPRDNGIIAYTLRMHDEVVAPQVAFENIPDKKPDARMVQIARKIIEQQEGDFEPEKFKDRYEEALRELIRRKEKGEKLVTAEPVEEEQRDRSDGSAAEKPEGQRGCAAKFRAQAGALERFPSKELMETRSSAKFLQPKKTKQSKRLHARAVTTCFYLLFFGAFSAKDEITPGWRKEPTRFIGAAVNAPMGWTIPRDLLTSLSLEGTRALHDQTSLVSSIPFHPERALASIRPRRGFGRFLLWGAAALAFVAAWQGIERSSTPFPSVASLSLNVPHLNLTRLFIARNRGGDAQ